MLLEIRVQCTYSHALCEKSKKNVLSRVNLALKTDNTEPRANIKVEGLKV